MKSKVKAKPAENELARRAYLVLIGLAAERKTTTYKLLAAQLGTHYRRTSYILGRIMGWCQAQRVPPLTALVVNANRGLPGSGLTTSVDRDADREKVFKFPWIEIVPPEAAELV